MLYGRFGDTSGRPYIEGRLILPRLNLESDISLLVDTGADSSLLMPLDGIRMGIDYHSLTGDNETVGTSGISHNFVEEAILVFSETGRQLSIYTLNFDIAPPTPDIQDIPSILGRDVLKHWRLVVDATKKVLTCEVRFADLTIPLHS